jgi:hypothetical protein
VELPLVVLESVGETDDVRAWVEADGRLSGQQQLGLKNELLFLSVCKREGEKDGGREK